MEILNPLISTQKSSGSSLEVALHPLALLSISDYITRHNLKRETSPMVGALLGQQHGREVTIEYAFECLVIEVDGNVILNQSWFEERLQQMKDVHKSPHLDLVGWYTTLPTSGPQLVHLPIHHQILQFYNESAILLGFHPALVAERSAGGKLPLTIYESNFESDDAVSNNGEDKEMKDEVSHLTLKFRELIYSIETGEAEMISVDFVARGGGNATAFDDTECNIRPNLRDNDIGHDGSLSFRTDDKAEKLATGDRILSREEEDLIASLTAKANAIKMLQTRINLIAIYLREFHHSRDMNQSSSFENYSADHTILRSIQALLNRLALLVPEDKSGFEQELLSEQNDVNLVSLLSTITESVKDIRQIGIKHGFIETAKAIKNKTNHPWGSSYKGVAGVGDLLP